MQSKIHNFDLDPRVKNCLKSYEENLSVMGIGPKSFSWK
jgi:hypothetical protein